VYVCVVVCDKRKSHAKLSALSDSRPGSSLQLYTQCHITSREVRRVHAPLPTIPIPTARLVSERANTMGCCHSAPSISTTAQVRAPCPASSSRFLKFKWVFEPRRFLKAGAARPEACVRVAPLLAPIFPALHPGLAHSAAKLVELKTWPTPSAFYSPEKKTLFIGHLFRRGCSRSRQLVGLEGISGPGGRVPGTSGPRSAPAGRGPLGKWAQPAPVHTCTFKVQVGL
jgi:hypothetical protein